MRRELRHGVARRAAQRLPVHPRHGALRRCTPACRCASCSTKPGSSRTRNGCCSKAATAAAMTRSLPLAKALDDALVAYRMNGEMLRPENGYPVRIVLPGWEANMWVKWLRRIEVGDEPWHTREETSKYTDLLENGQARRFTYVMDAKSVITSPSPQAPLNHKSRPHGAVGHRLVRPRQDRARRRLARRRPQLADGAARRAGLGQGADALLPRVRLGRPRAAAAIARHRRDRLRAAEQGRAAQATAASTRSTTTTASRPGT